MSRTSAFKRALRIGLSSHRSRVGMVAMGCALAFIPLVGQAQANNSVRCDPGASLAEYQTALHDHPQSSLANYCIAELLFNQRNYQASAFAYRFALHGDGDPSWTKAWSYVQLGKIFDATGQRDRAFGQYQLAIQTGDNTHGAVDVAKELQQKLKE